MNFLQIFRILVPFVVVSFLLVFAFSFAFYINGFDGEKCALIDDDAEDDPSTPGFCTIGHSMRTTMSYFYSGPEPTTLWWLDQLFGIIITVVLLNVLIAVVSDAWADNKIQSNRAYWGYRIMFLREIEFMNNLFPKTWQRHQGEQQRHRRLLDWIDEIGDMRVLDTVHWSTYPYCAHIKSAQDYYKFARCPDKRKAEGELKQKLASCGSLERDYYWACRHVGSREVKVEDPNGGPTITFEMKTKWQIAKECFLYFALMPLGFFTFGILWPRRFRQAVFGMNTKVDAELSSKGGLEERLVALEAKLDSIAKEDRLAALESRLEAFLDAAHSKLHV